MIEEVKYGKWVMKKEFNKKFIMSKKDEKDFWKAEKGWISGNKYVEIDVWIRDHYHANGKYR